MSPREKMTPYSGRALTGDEEGRLGGRGAAEVEKGIYCVSASQVRNLGGHVAVTPGRLT